MSSLTRIHSPNQCALMAWVIAMASYSPACAQTAQVAGFPYPPLTTSSGTGIAPAIVASTFRAVGIDFQFEPLPVKRAFEVTKNGEAFFLGSLYGLPNVDGLEIAPVIEVRPTLLYRKGDFDFKPNASPDAIHQALTGRSVGLLFGYEDNPILTKYGMKYETFQNLTSAVKMLLSKRFDFLPCFEDIQCPRLIQLAQDEGVTVTQVPFKVAPSATIGLIYDKRSEKLATLAKAFNQSMKKLQASGEYGRLLLKETYSNGQ